MPMVGYIQVGGLPYRSLWHPEVELRGGFFHAHLFASCTLACDAVDMLG